MEFLRSLLRRREGWSGDLVKRRLFSQANAIKEIAINHWKNFKPWFSLIDLTVDNIILEMSFLVPRAQQSISYIIASLSKTFAATATYPYQVVRSTTSGKTNLLSVFSFPTSINVYQWTIGEMGGDDDSLLHAAIYLVMLRKRRDSIASLLFLLLYIIFLL